MKVSRIQAVEMARRIRDRQTRGLAGKTADEVIAFYRAAGQAAVEEARATGETSPAQGDLTT